MFGIYGERKKKERLAPKKVEGSLKRVPGKKIVFKRKSWVEKENIAQIWQKSDEVFWPKNTKENLARVGRRKKKKEKKLAFMQDLLKRQEEGPSIIPIQNSFL